jgi:hypothetical protein
MIAVRLMVAQVLGITTDLLLEGTEFDSAPLAPTNEL